MTSDSEEDILLEQFWETHAGDLPVCESESEDEAEETALFSKWSYLNELDEVSITTDNHDHLLLRVAKEEMAEVARRVKGALGTTAPTRSAVANIFLKDLVPVLVSAMNASIPSGDDATERFGEGDVVEFIRCLAIMSFYRETPSNFFNTALADAYPAASTRSQATFRRCLKALSLGMRLARARLPAATS